MILVAVSSGVSKDGDEELYLDYIADAVFKGPYQFPSDGDDAASIGDDDLEKLHIHVPDEHGKWSITPANTPSAGMRNMTFTFPMSRLA
jgi:hypothetical protein